MVYLYPLDEDAKTSYYWSPGGEAIQTVWTSQCCSVLQIPVAGRNRRLTVTSAITTSICCRWSNQFKIGWDDANLLSFSDRMANEETIDYFSEPHLLKVLDVCGWLTFFDAHGDPSVTPRTYMKNFYVVAVESDRPTMYKLRIESRVMGTTYKAIEDWFEFSAPFPHGFHSRQDWPANIWKTDTICPQAPDRWATPL